MATKLPPEHWLSTWQKAAEQEIGIEILCHPDDQMLIVNALYECRKQFGRFGDLMIAQPMPRGTIFILKKQQEELPI